MLNPIFMEKKEYFKMSSAEIFTQHAQCLQHQHHVHVVMATRLFLHYGQNLSKIK